MAPELTVDKLLWDLHRIQSLYVPRIRSCAVSTARKRLWLQSHIYRVNAKCGEAHGVHQ